ncbi:MAG: Hpt domain-containing protein [Pseudomonadota bacterium]
MSTQIDLAALKKLKDLIGGETEDLAELVEDFVATFPSQVTSMRSEVAAEDWSALRITAHTCKSNARDIGATALFQKCAALELECENGMPHAPDAQVTAIEEAGTMSIKALQDVDLANV